MAVLPSDRIRNVVLLSHQGAGTTTLAEALLARAGAVGRAGSVATGTSVLDTEPEAVKRQMSVSAALAPLRWTAPDGLEYQINLIDVPGYADFAGAAEAAMTVADLALLVVSAVDGIEVQTELLWKRAAARGLPRMVFITKEDRERADFHGVLAQLRQRFGTGFVPLEEPDGEAQSLHGVTDVLSDESNAMHDTLVEEIVAGDDAQLERYLSGDTLSVVDLERTLRHEVLDGIEFPVLLGSAVTGVGLDRLADYICELAPSPVDRPTDVLAGDERIPVMADAAGAPLAYVFATVADPFVGQLSVFKVLSGTVRADDHLVNSRTGADERLHGLFVLRGSEQTPVTEVVAGDIAAVARLTATRTFDTLAPKGSPVTVPVPQLPVPHHAIAIVPHSQTDDDKLSAALAKMQVDDPVLLVHRDVETHQTVVRGLGDVHVAVTLERMARLFNVSVDTEPVRVAYRETIAGHAEVEGKVKKQSGGHGQFAVANLRVAPLDRGAGFEFIDSVVGGAIPRNMIHAVEKGIEEAMAAGGPHGFPVVDLRVECTDGKFHPVDSSEMAFKTAASVGLKDALTSAGALVLEPISLVHVTAPTAHQGDVMSDISSRRGRVMGTEAAADGHQTVVAHVPAVELRTYSIDLRSITSGYGTFTVQHDHYDVLPDGLAAKLPPR